MDEHLQAALDHVTKKLDEVLKLLHGNNGLVTRVALLEQRVNSQSARLWDFLKIAVAVAAATLATHYYG